MVIAAPVLKPKPATLPANRFLQQLMLIANSRITSIIQTYAGETVKAVKLRQK